MTSSAEIHTTKANDIVLTVVGWMIGLAFLWYAVIGVWGTTSDHFAGVRGEGFIVVLFDVFGPWGFSLGSGLMALLPLSMGLGGSWRLWRPGPAVAAIDQGLRFHPSIGPTFIDWRQVETIRWTRKSPGRIEIRLHRRPWSLWNWTASRTIRFDHIAVGLSWKQAEAVVREMRRARPSQLASRE